MKLSIILIAYNDSDRLIGFLNSLKKQIIQDFELVIVLDTKLNNTLKVVSDYIKEDDHQYKIKFLYNMKRVGRTSAIIEAIKNSTSEYIVITSASDVLYKTATKKILNLIDRSKGSDIIEFNARVKEPFKIQGHVRKEFKGKVNLTETTLPIAYTFPMDFNKIYKRELLNNVQIKSFPKIENRFSLEIFVKAFLHAKTYTNFDVKIIRSFPKIRQQFNVLDFIKEWKKIGEYITMIRKDELSAFIYLQYYHLKIIVPALLSHMDSNVIAQKYWDKYISYYENTLKNLLEENIYFQTKNEETSFLKNAATLKQHLKLYKEI